MRYLRLFPILALLGAIIPAETVDAYNQPLLNFGLTSFLDGGPPSGPGFYFAEYLQYYTADKMADMPIDDPKLNMGVSLTQILYQSDTEVLPGARWGLNLATIFVSIDGNWFSDVDFGRGDLLVGPYLQWDPIMGDNGPIMLHRIELQTFWPTGEYDDDKLVNPSSNHFYFNPYWGGTLFLGSKVTASWRIHYLWNDRNKNPSKYNPYGAVDYIQPGQAWHGVFAAAVEVVPKTLRVGINGYFFDQLTSTRADGRDIDDDERVFGIGPGFVLHLNKDMHLFFNAYKETSAEHRPEGERYNLRFVWHL